MAVLSAFGALAQDPPSPKAPVAVISSNSGGVFEAAEIADDGSHVAIFGRDHIEFWSIEPVKYLGSVKHEGHPTYHRFTPKGLGFVTGVGADLRVGSLEKGIEWQLQAENKGYIGPIALSPSGELIAVAVAPGCVDSMTATAYWPKDSEERPNERIEVHKLKDGALVKTLEVPSPKPGACAGIAVLAFSTDETWLAVGLMLSSRHRSLGDVTMVAKVADWTWSFPCKGHLEGFGAPGEVLISSEEPRSLDAAKLSDLAKRRRIYTAEEWAESFVPAGERVAILRDHEVVVASSSTGRVIWKLPMSHETFGNLEREGSRFGGVRLTQRGHRLALLSPMRVPAGRVEVWDAP